MYSIGTGVITLNICKIFYSLNNTFSLKFYHRDGTNGYFITMHASWFELSTFGTVLPHPQDEIISWGPSRRGPPVLHFIAILACPIAAIGFGLSRPEYEELAQFS